MDREKENKLINYLTTNDTRKQKTMNKITSINGILLSSQNDFYQHEKNSSVHVTEDERTAWNANGGINIGGSVRFTAPYRYPLMSSPPSTRHRKYCTAHS